MPTLCNIACLVAFVPPHQIREILQPETDITALERPEQSGSLHAHDLLQDTSDLASLEAAFDSIIAPAIVAPVTRARYFASWRTIVTFAYTVSALDQLLPMSTALLKAFLLNAVLVGYRVGTITGFISAIRHRHRLFDFPFNVEAETLRSWIGAIRRNRGLPLTPKFKLMPFHLKAMLERPLNTLCRLRDVLMIAIGTVCALRVSELVNLDLCDLSWNHDGEDTLMLRIRRRKNDKYREGLFPRIGAARNPRYDIIRLLKTYLAWGRLMISTSCTRTRFPAEPCTACGPLFRRIAPSGTELSEARISRSHVAGALDRALTAINVCSHGYSTVSMRKGGVSAAVCAGIPHDLRAMQTGHRSSAWENYFDLDSQEELYRFYNVFGL